jgi:hypothetical protein
MCAALMPSRCSRLRPPHTGRYVRIVQTGKADQYYWSIHELQVVPG